MSFPNVYKAPLSLFSNHLVLNNYKQWELISSINFVALQSAFLSIFFLHYLSSCHEIRKKAEKFRT